MQNEICCFGDSITKGVVYDTEKQRYSVTEKNFIKLFSESQNINVNNYSKFGCTVERGLKIAAQNVNNLKNCNCVALEFGGNDCDFDWGSISENPDAEYTSKTPIDTFIDSYKKIINQVKNMGKQVVIINLPPLDAGKYFAWVSRGRNRENLIKWLGNSTEYIYRWHEFYNTVVGDIANQMMVPLIDIRSEFLKKKNYSDFLCADGIHPNEDGHELIFNAFTGAYPM
ncbi:MAG: SGNH/GDSL hydrolase family protein [Bacillota bacterium]|nr:SGNH/GDSL hydrolase family protein [Bacillota bacterium]